MQTAVVDRLRDELEGALGPGSVLVGPEDLAAYRFDAYSDTRLPTAVVVPRDANEVAAVVRIARAFGEPIVARGAENGLCGGAVPFAGGVTSFARMKRILAVDPRSVESFLKLSGGLTKPSVTRRNRSRSIR